MEVGFTSAYSDGSLSTNACKAMDASSNQRMAGEIGFRSDRPEKPPPIFLDDQLEPSGGSSEKVTDLKVQN